MSGLFNSPLSPEDFVCHYWQQRPYLFRAAFPAFSGYLDADELAGLALEQDVESRLVISHSNQDTGQCDWQLRHGPFDTEDFSLLPAEGWTLLVQAVNHWLPEMAGLLQHFAFIPEWRIDDVMVSYATRGGGVGPHFDHYDVFLLQGQGRRRWQLGQACNADSPCLPDSELLILSDFSPVADWELQCGDMLYVPPHLAHWGTALSDSLCYSIGFRAPSSADVLLSFSQYLAEQLSEFERYEDRFQRLSTPAGSRVDEHSIERFANIIGQQLTDKSRLTDWLGRFLSQAKYPVADDQQDANELQAGDSTAAGRLRQQLDGVLLRNPACRIVLIDQAGQPALYADGKCLYRSSSGRTGNCGDIELLQLLATKHNFARGELQRFVDDPNSAVLLARCIAQDLLVDRNDLSRSEPEA